MAETLAGLPHPAFARSRVAPLGRDREPSGRRAAWGRLAVAGRDGRPGDDDGPPRRRPGRRRPPGRWRVVLWRVRMPFAAVLLGCAVALALADLRPPPPPRTPVVVAARDVPAGSPLAEHDVTVAFLPPDAVADGAHPRPGAVLGRTTVVAVPAGLPVVEALLADDRLGAAGPPGTDVVPVRLADAGVAALLRPGDRIDLFGATTSATGAPVAERLAHRALVLPHPAPTTADRAGLLGAAPEQPASLILVAVGPEQAAGLAAASAWGGITAVLVE